MDRRSGDCEYCWGQSHADLSPTQEEEVFRVEADSLAEYFAFDPERKSDLQKLDKLVRASAPGLERYFHRGTPAGEPGMRFKMIGYGRLEYLARSGQSVEWPVVGVALQKNYISVYCSLLLDGAPLTDSWAGKLGESRMGRNNFSFESFDQLEEHAVRSLFAEADRIFSADPRSCLQRNTGPARRATH